MFGGGRSLRCNILKNEKVQNRNLTKSSSFIPTWVSLPEHRSSLEALLTARSKDKAPWPFAAKARETITRDM